MRRLRSASKTEREKLLARVSHLAEVVAEVERHVHLPRVAIPELSGTRDWLRYRGPRGADGTPSRNITMEDHFRQAANGHEMSGPRPGRLHLLVSRACAGRTAL